MNDIQTKQDIERLVQRFYEKVVQDPDLKPFFGEVVSIDWDHHLPIMVGFWEFILFSTPNSYMGNVMNPHFKIHEIKSIEPNHFERWLTLFKETVDELFSGPKAEDAKNAAINIGATMKYKIKKLYSEN